MFSFGFSIFISTFPIPISILLIQIQPSNETQIQLQNLKLLQTSAISTFPLPMIIFLIQLQPSKETQNPVTKPKKKPETSDFSTNQNTFPQYRSNKHIPIRHGGDGFEGQNQAPIRIRPTVLPPPQRRR